MNGDRLGQRTGLGDSGYLLMLKFNHASVAPPLGHNDSSGSNDAFSILEFFSLDEANQKDDEAGKDETKQSDYCAANDCHPESLHVRLGDVNYLLVRIKSHQGTSVHNPPTRPELRANPRDQGIGPYSLSPSLPIK